MYVFKKYLIKKNSGIILIELLLVILLSGLILNCLIKIYLATEKNYQLQHALITIQNNADTFSHIMRSELYQTGYIGCPRLTDDFPLISHTQFILSPHQLLTGGNNSLSNIITIRHAEVTENTLLSIMSTLDTMSVTKNILFNKNNLLIISDCKQADIFLVKQIITDKNTEKIISQSLLQKKYDANSQVMRLLENTFFIANTKRQDIDGNDIFSLYEKDITRQQTELIEGVNSMQIKYKIKRNGNFAILSAQDILDWAEVIGVFFDVEFQSGKFKKSWHYYFRGELKNEN